MKTTIGALILLLPMGCGRKPEGNVYTEPPPHIYLVQYADGRRDTITAYNMVAKDWGKTIEFYGLGWTPTAVIHGEATVRELK